MHTRETYSSDQLGRHRQQLEMCLINSTKKVFQKTTTYVIHMLSASVRRMSVGLHDNYKSKFVLYDWYDW